MVKINDSGDELTYSYFVEKIWWTFNDFEKRCTKNFFSFKEMKSLRQVQVEIERSEVRSLGRRPDKDLDRGQRELLQEVCVFTYK